MRVAAIDVGSNSIKLSIGEVEDGHVRVVGVDRITLQLGRPVASTGSLGDEAIAAAAQAVGQLATQARLAGARRIDLVGTSAVREAGDGDRLRAEAAAAAGVPMRILSGLDEAHLVSRSIEVSLGMPLRTAVMFDIGGGSTEVVHVEGGLVAAQHSIPLGAVDLTQRLGLDGAQPLRDADLEALQREIDEHLEPCIAAPESGAAPRIGFGCGGTITALARLHHFGLPPSGGAAAVDRLFLPRAAVEGLADQLAGASLDDRMAMTALEPDRARIIPAGAAIAARLMRRLDLDDVQVHEQGIRTGLMADLAMR